MSGSTSTASTSTAATNPPPLMSQQPSNPSHKGGSGRGRKSNHHHNKAHERNYDDDSQSSYRRGGKRPEVEHYKPGAFTSSRKEGSDDKKNTKKVNNHDATVEESEGHRKKKKPEQAHYVPKKSNDAETKSNNVQEKSDKKAEDKGGKQGAKVEGKNRKRGSGTKKEGKGGNNASTLEREKDTKKTAIDQRNGHAMEGKQNGVEERKDHHHHHNYKAKDDNALPPRLRDRQNSDSPRQSSGSKRGKGRGGGVGRHSRGSSPGTHNNGQQQQSPVRRSNEELERGSRSSSTRRGGGSRGGMRDTGHGTSSPTSPHRNNTNHNNNNRYHFKSPPPRRSPRRDNHRNYSPMRRGYSSMRYYRRGGGSHKDDWGNRYYREGSHGSDEFCNSHDRLKGSSALPHSSNRPNSQIQNNISRFQKSSNTRGGGSNNFSSNSGDRSNEKRVAEDRQFRSIDEELLTSRISDWSLEVEEEDNRNNHANKPPPSPTSRHAGIIRLPQSDSGNWRSDNPAWRGVENSSQDKSWRQHPSRVLYDPKNPAKPIPVPASNNLAPSLPPPAPSPSSSNGGGPMMKHRFNPEPPQPFPAVNYRHPYPPIYGFSLRPNGPDWYDVYNQRIYGNDKHDINNITLIVRSDMTLYNITMQGSGLLLCQLWDTEVTECRQNILKAFQQLLKSDLVFCAEHNVEFHIWKIAFWNLMEVLKIMLPEDESAELRGLIKGHITQLLDEGLDFYTRMLELLDTTYNIGLETYYDILEPRPTDKMVRCALMSAQNCLLCLGDLARYQEQINDTSNYGKARQYYQKASHIETRNGRPFNLLAILANMTKRKFEAVYYNMRCLQSKNPFSASNQSLILIFEEVKKKWEALEKKKIEEKESRFKKAEREKEGSQLIKGTRLRKEIWIRPEGGRRLHRTTSARETESVEDVELMEMSTSDLNKRFNNTFLYLIGKLFTHIDMDTFPLALELLQKEFRILVSSSPLPIDSKRLVQIMALNMFVIEHTKIKSGDADNYRSTMQDAALQLAFEMFGILVERCNTLFQGFTPDFNSESQSIFEDEDLSILLSAVKVWCDWLLGNNDTWYPVVTDEPFNQLAKLATHLEKLKPFLRPILSRFVPENAIEHGEEKAFSLIKLDEDAVLCGFNPWFRGLDWSSYRRYYPTNSLSSVLAQEVRRIDAINFCVDFLEGLEPPLLKWSLPDNAHISLVESEGSSAAEKVNAKLSNMLARHEDILEESYSDEENESSSSSTATAAASTSPPAPSVDDSILNDKIRMLKHRKEELERRRLAEEKEMKRMQRQLLSEHVSVTLEVRPRYLVADTNCFVDHLEEIKKLTLSSHYQLRVPLVVLNELDGLAKGARPSKYSSHEHAIMVSENARRALAFLKDRPPNTKCVTAKGTVLPSFAVTTEEDSNEGKKNDDLILDACFNLSDKKEETRGKMRIVHRDVILLTDDRNLKLKAHITDIPVNKLTDFIHWVNLS